MNILIIFCTLDFALSLYNSKEIIISNQIRITCVYVSHYKFTDKFKFSYLLISSYIDRYTYRIKLIF